MQQDILVKLQPSDIQSVLEQLNPLFEGSIFDPEHTTILSQNLSFYPGYQYLDIVSYKTTPPLRRLVLYSKQQSVILNFSNIPLYAFNKELPIKLDKNNIDDYVRFFFKNVQGEHGSFLIVENVDDIHWKEEPPPSARQAVGKMITPLTQDKVDDRGFYNLSACMIFKDSLFKVRIKIDIVGQVTISDEHLLIEDIPVFDDIFSQ